MRVTIESEPTTNFANFNPILPDLSSFFSGNLVACSTFAEDSFEWPRMLLGIRRKILDLLIARNRGHFASVINCQRHLFFKMADKNNRSQGKRFPYDILNTLSSLDLFYEVYILWNKKHGYWVKFGVVKLFLFRVRPKWSFANMAPLLDYKWKTEGNNAPLEVFCSAEIVLFTTV